MTFLYIWKKWVGCISIKISIGELMRLIICVLLPFFFSSAMAQSIELPKIKTGDMWTYVETAEDGPSSGSQFHSEYTVTHVTSSNIYYTLKRPGSDQPPKDLFMGSDWSLSRDYGGKETLLNRPMLFPLSVGKKWDLQYVLLARSKMYKDVKWEFNYTAVGFEAVEVVAGKFNAIKIEVEGRWIGQVEPNQTILQNGQTNQNRTTMVTQVQKTSDETRSGKVYKAFWYVPEVKRWVKSVVDVYSNTGVRGEHYTSELESYKLAE